MSLGKLYLIPVPLADNAREATYTLRSLNLINEISEYIVENEKTARRFLKEAGIKISQDQLLIHDYGKHARKDFDIKKAFTNIYQGRNIAFMSEAGCPGIADPGSAIVQFAHQQGIEVVPLVGPSSILLALMASGFNGQNFSFIGYLPIDKSERTKKIKSLESSIYRDDQTQIFIETPFRNNQLFGELIKTCKQQTKLCLATDLTSSKEFVRTQAIGSWKEQKPELHKRPTIFLLYK